MPTESSPKPRFLARQLAIGFGAVSVVAIGMCALLLSTVHGVSDQIARMRHDEAAISDGLALSAAVRELSLHIAHTVIEGDDSHLARYGEARDRVRSLIQRLSPAIPVAERGRLQSLAERTQRMHEVLTQEALPLAGEGDAEAARRVHRELERLGQGAAADADVLARAAAREMTHAHIDATELTRMARVAGGLGVALVLALSVGFTMRLRAAVLRPLATLTDAARRFGRGDFGFRVGAVGAGGRGELGALATAFDHMADELAQREARLLHHERMAAIGQLAAGVAHELNNPIGIIRGYLDTMNPDGDRAVLREELAILDEEAGHCQRIAEDLLSYARGGDLEFAPVDVAAFLAATVARFAESPAGHGRVVEVEAQDAELEADPVRLRQVLMNLLANAAQVSPEDAPLRVRGRLAGALYVIEVQDRGPGVPEAERTRVFEPFFTKRPGGSGLGLSVCMGIVRAHGGEVRVRDAEGGGAVFEASLPLHRPRTSSAPPGERAEATGP